MSKNKKTKDVDFASKAVPADSRKGLVTMFMIMLGFTFFSAAVIAFPPIFLEMDM